MNTWFKPAVSGVTFAFLVALAGCKYQLLPKEATGDVKSAQLAGPEAPGEPPAVELPAADSARLCLTTAQEFERNEQIEEATRLYAKARSLDPTLARQAGRRLAVLYDVAGDFSKADAEYQALLKADPKDAEVHNDFGYSHYCRGDWAAAEAHLSRAVQLDPTKKRASINLGLARAQQGKIEESFQAFSAAVRPADAHCNIAFVLAAQGKTELAKDQYRQALTLDPSLRQAKSALVKLDGTRDGSPGEAVAAQPPVKHDPAATAATVPTVEQLDARMSGRPGQTATGAP
ncbi:tetratricopeptide repeat protein [Fimbriiglobus ruber]|uniref:TPR Domain containing protein n=1 Tax=Fimbriiglobus ruber TaxID=1908690 RepID=A0A225D2S0_9BACT|nr:tetratricopeptide repeat protein [Fimbriiglobus ruber]OWK35253.1 TPR Domain containing protein [Fimbriiglobus ruber]